MTDSDTGPRHAFEDSRRLTGPSRWSAGTAVELTALSSAAGLPSAHAAWAARVRAICSALGWPDPQPVARRHAGGTTLAFAAPDDTLLTATEVNEWAWEQAAGARVANEGFDEAHGVLHAPVATFAERADAERSRPLARLTAAARERGVPVTADDDALTLGAGHASVTFARAALPLPLDVPWPRLHDIPKALVTGSNGKTTTVRLIAAMARAAGHRAGLTSTEGIVIDGEPVAGGDYSGPAGARTVLRDRRVSLAVLETARGGLARRGLAVAQADVAIVTNLSADHFGEYGIHNVVDLAELKLVVARAVVERGLLVLNADDAVLMAAAERLPHAAAARRALFALDHDTPALAALREQRGGATCGAAQGRLRLHHEQHTHDLGAVADLPLAFGGAAGYNLMNLTAAALAAVAGLGLPIEAVRATLHSFGRDPRDNPGRLERHAWRGATVLIDYAHNPDGLARLLALARALPHQRLLLLLGQAGNRDDAAIADLARTAAAARPDLVMLKELPTMLRGRASGEVSMLLGQALRSGEVQPQPQSIVNGGDEADAAAALLDAAQAGDVVVLPLHSDEGRAAVSARIVRDGGSMSSFVATVISTWAEVGARLPEYGFRSSARSDTSLGKAVIEVEGPGSTALIEIWEHAQCLDATALDLASGGSTVLGAGPCHSYAEAHARLLALRTNLLKHAGTQGDA
jgi:cyanophycin synthetase